MTKILFRQKKKEFEGFKSYVQQLETTPYEHMIERFQYAALEDPVYMSWVAKNLLDINKFLNIQQTEFEYIYRSTKEILPILVDAFYGTKEDSEMRALLRPADYEKYDYECSIHSGATAERREHARFALYKAFRNLQRAGNIQGNPWRLPPLEVVRNPKSPAQPNGHFEQLFDETNRVALKGEMRKGRREGVWEHFYTTGKTMARGEYQEGEYEGLWIFFYANGLRKSEGNFTKGKRTGLWTMWDRAGAEYTINYDEAIDEDADGDDDEEGTEEGREEEAA